MSLASCIPNFMCSGLMMNNAVKQGVTMSPYVKLSVEAGGESTIITMGNKSSPNLENSAAIKSFEFGGTDGCSAEFVIVDEKGGEFERFEKRIVKTLCTDSAPKVCFSFGWIYTDCDGGTGTDSMGSGYDGDAGDNLKWAEPGDNGGGGEGVMRIEKVAKIYCMIKNIGVQFETTGMVKYTLKCTDFMQTIFVAKEDDTWGSDDSPMLLKDALVALGNTHNPKINIERKKRVNKGVAEWDFEDNPKTKWDSDGQNKLSTVKRWTEGFVTKGDKLGIVPAYDWTKEKPTLTLWQDYGQKCSDRGACEKTIGTFIVNGGKDSNVISFTPTIDYVAGLGTMSSGGAVPTSSTGTSVPVEKMVEDKDEERICNWMEDGDKDKAGAMSGIPHNPYCWAVFGPDYLVKYSKNQNANSRAEQMCNPSLSSPIKAELKIMGNTDNHFVSPVLLKGSMVSIIVCNPYYLQGGGGGGCGDWLAQPPCNTVLTNRKWMIMGVQHSINESSYTTTLTLQLSAPIQQLHEGLPYGGDDRGYHPGPSCTGETGWVP